MNENIIYDSEKFKSMIHYIISMCQSKENIERAALYELLYFSDFDNYEKFETSISGETYTRKQMGVVPTHFLKAIEELIGEGKIEEKCEQEIKFRYSSLTKPDISSLTYDEIQVIDDTINRFSHFYSSEIYQYSPGDIPWRLAKEGEISNYEAVFYRDPQYSVREYDE